MDVWQWIMNAGAPLGISPYGTEAMSILRIEKGHVVSGEINGRTTAGDLGFSSMLSTTKDYIGRHSLTRPALNDDGRKQLVGLIPDAVSPVTDEAVKVRVTDPVFIDPEKERLRG